MNVWPEKILKMSREFWVLAMLRHDKKSLMEAFDPSPDYTVGLPGSSIPKVHQM
jgi:hypothetical protein